MREHSRIYIKSNNKGKKKGAARQYHIIALTLVHSLIIFLFFHGAGQSASLFRFGVYSREEIREEPLAH